MHIYGDIEKNIMRKDRMDGQLSALYKYTPYPMLKPKPYHAVVNRTSSRIALSQIRHIATDDDPVHDLIVTNATGSVNAVSRSDTDTKEILFKERLGHVRVFCPVLLVILASYPSGLRLSPWQSLCSCGPLSS